MKKNKLLKLAILAPMLTVLFASSCKEDPVEPDKPDDTTTVVVGDTLHPVRELNDIRLYIPQNKDATDYKFYNITNATYSSDVESTIELAFFFDDSQDSRHHLGSSEWATLRGQFDINSSNAIEVEFFNMNDEGKTFLYDTLRDERSIPQLIMERGTPSPIIGGIQSDEFGWTKDEIIGFRLPTGERGLIKIQKNPEIVKDINGILTDGRITLDIKMQQIFK